MSLELDYDYFIQIREAFKKKIKSVDFFHMGGGQPQIHTDHISGLEGDFFNL